MSWLTTYRTAQGEPSISTHRDNSLHEGICAKKLTFPMFSHVLMPLCCTVEIVQFSPTSVAERLLLLSMLVGFGDIMNLNADWKSFLALPQWCCFCPGGNKKQNPGFQKEAKEQSSSVRSESCSYPSNKANLTDFQAGRTSQKFHYFAELAAVFLMFTRHRKGGVEKGIIGWKISTGQTK